jgi:hypothetical protein
MPWLFIPVIVSLCFVNGMWLPWGSYVAVVLSVWLGFRYGVDGAKAVAMAWAPFVFSIGTDALQSPARFDLALLSVGTAYLCAMRSPGEAIRRAVDRVLESRLAWALLLILPLFLFVPIVHDAKVVYLGARLHLSNVLIAAPLILASVGVDSKAIKLLLAVGLASTVGTHLRLTLPVETSSWMSARVSYGTLSVANFAMMLVALGVGIVIRRLSVCLPVSRVWLWIGLFVVGLAVFNFNLKLGESGYATLVNSVGFTLVGALLAGVSCGTAGAAASTLVSLLAVLLFYGWAFTETRWVAWAEMAVSGWISWGGPQNHLPSLPLLAAVFGVVGAEIRALVLKGAALAPLSSTSPVQDSAMARPL